MRVLLVIAILFGALPCVAAMTIQQYLFNRKDIESVKAAIGAGDDSYNAALTNLRLDANAALGSAHFPLLLMKQYRRAATNMITSAWQSIGGPIPKIRMGLTFARMA